MKYSFFSLLLVGTVWVISSTKADPVQIDVNNIRGTLPLVIEQPASGGIVKIDFTGGGSGQVASVFVDAGTRAADLSLAMAANNSTARATLNGVYGVPGEDTSVSIIQTTLSSGAIANLTVNGAGYPMGQLPSVGVGVYVRQNSTGAHLNTTITAAGPGYTAKLKQ